MFLKMYFCSEVNSCSKKETIVSVVEVGYRVRLCNISLNVIQVLVYRIDGKFVAVKHWFWL